MTASARRSALLGVRTATPIAVALLLAACGTEPAEDSASPGTEPAAQVETQDTAQADGATGKLTDEAEGAQAEGAGGTPLEAVYAEVEGLDAEARRARLAELAETEEGALQFYTSMNSDQATPWLDAFGQDTDVEVEYVRGSAGDILNRILQEEQAGYRGADVVSNTGPEVLVLAREGVCGPLQILNADELLEGTVHPTFAASGLNVFVPVWNADVIDTPPTTWEEALDTERMVFDPRDYQWFMTLVEGYLMGQQGLSEEQAIQLVTEAMRGDATPVEGHSTGMELLAAGEFAIHPSQYHHQTSIFDDASAVAWEPIVEPLIVQQNGVCIHADTERPASSLLLVDWALSAQGQELYAGLGRDAASAALEGSVINGRDSLVIDLDKTLDEQEKWEGLFEELVRAATS